MNVRTDELIDGERESYTSGGGSGNLRYRWGLTAGLT